MAGNIDKGNISRILDAKDWNGHPMSATVNPCTNSGAITPALTIPWYLRGEMGGLKVGDCVAYAVFDDATGIILDRLDGEWTGVIDYPTRTTGDVKHDKTVTTTGKTTTQDVTTSAIGSVNGHTHMSPHGETSGPHG